MTIRKRIILAAKSIKDSDSQAGIKLKILGEMFQEPNVGHIVPSGKGIVKWLESNKFYPELNQQDHCDWWTVAATDKRKEE